MKWNEQPGDVQPALMSELLRGLSALDAILLASRARRGPTVYLSPECRNGILSHLRSYRTEVGGLLIGRAYVGGADLPESWGPLVWIEQFLASETFRSSRVSLAMGTEIWERARVATARNSSIIVGWYHSHPNLGAFFSTTDRATQRAFFNRAYSVGLVIDPGRGEECWFIGPDSTSLDLQSVSHASLAATCAPDRTAPTQEHEP